MKKWKRAAALAAVALLLIAFCLPMVFAFGEGEAGQSWFRAALGIAILVPVFAYMIVLVYGMLNRKKASKPEGIMKNVIFDVGNVLVDYAWPEYLESFGYPKEKYEKIADAVFRNPVWNDRDQGLLEEEEYVTAFVKAAPEYEAEIREIMRRSPECIILRDYAQTWIKYLKEKGYRIYILSNYSRYMMEHTRAKLAFLKYVDGEIFSYEVKQIKPNEDIFETLMARYGLKAEESVFLDDNKENCETARRLGIHAIQFDNLKQAAGELKKLGVQ